MKKETDMKPHELKVGKIYQSLIKQPFIGKDLSPFLLLEIDCANSLNLVKLKFLTKTKIEVFSVSIDRNFECLSI